MCRHIQNAAFSTASLSRPEPLLHSLRGRRRPEKLRDRDRFPLNVARVHKHAAANGAVLIER